MSKSQNAKIRDSLFSFRFADLVLIEGQWVDNISANVTFSQKLHLVNVMLNFCEPLTLRKSRYSDDTVESNVLDYAIDFFNSLFDYPHFQKSGYDYVWDLPCDRNMLAGQFTPFLFNIIEIQYKFLSKEEKRPFSKAINESLDDDAVAFCFKNGQFIQRIETEVYFDISSEELENLEQGLQDLINEAIAKHRQSNSSAHKDAVEKIWDAFERLKTVLDATDKKKSAEQLVSVMANGDKNFIKLFNDEFKALTEIGNNYRIRHHETNKIEITDLKYYDYFFNRCLSLIALAIQYLK